METEIKNKILRDYLKSIDDGTVTLDSIDEFGENIDSNGLNEFFTLLENDEDLLFALKIYTMVYDSEMIAELNSKRSFNFVDMTFGKMWKNEIQDCDIEELKEAALGFKIFSSDLIKRVRNGYHQEDFDVEELDNQIKELVLSYKDDIDNGILIKTLSQSEDDLIDEELFAIDDEELEPLKKVRDLILFADIAYKYKESDSVSERQAFVKEVEAFNLVEDDLYFLPSSYLAILNDIKISKAVENADTAYITKKSEPKLGSLLSESSFNKEIVNDEDLDDIDDLDIIKDQVNEGSLIKGLKSLVSSGNSSSGSVGQPDLKSLTMKSTRKKKQNHLKFTAAMLFLLAVMATLLSAFSQKEMVESDSSIGEKVVEQQVESKIEKEQFEIKRTGTNKDTE
jgi:hypothetical protein